VREREREREESREREKELNSNDETRFEPKYQLGRAGKGITIKKD
jgi:hypothetical protein